MPSIIGKLLGINQEEGIEQLGAEVRELLGAGTARELLDGLIDTHKVRGHAWIVEGKFEFEVWLEPRVEINVREFHPEGIGDLKEPF